MPTQVQIRGAAQATQEARTLVSRVLDVNVTDSRLSVHDGSTTGGIPHVTCYDNQNNEFSYATTSGTNALTATLNKAPTAYTAGQVFWLKIGATNTSTATLNINSLGAKSIKKILNGTLSNIEAGDLISGQVVGFAYDGVQFQIQGGSVNKTTNTYTPSIVNGSEGAATIANREIQEYTVIGDLVHVTVLLEVSEMSGTDTLNSHITLPFNAKINQNLGQCWNGWSLAIGDGEDVKAAMTDDTNNVTSQGCMIAKGGTNQAYFKDSNYNRLSFNFIENQWVFASFTYIKS